MYIKEDDIAMNWTAVFHFDNKVTSRINSSDLVLSLKPDTNISLNIIIIDDIKYEKVQYTDTVNIKNTMREIFPHYWGLWGVQLCGQVDGHESPCFHVFQVSTPLVSYTEGDIVISHWTVLRGID